jgi:hypothetical protein
MLTDGVAVGPAGRMSGILARAMPLPHLAVAVVLARHHRSLMFILLLLSQFSV